MPKITTNNASGLLIQYAIKIVVSSILSILILSTFCSFAVLKFDINLDILQYLGTAICIISAILISLISLTGFKNNYLVLSIISVLPLLIFTIINFCIHKTDPIFIIVKIAGIIIGAFAVSIFKSGRKSR